MKKVFYGEQASFYLPALAYAEIPELSDTQKVSILKELDLAYAGTDQDLEEWAAEYQMAARMLLHHEAIILNPQHLLIEECDEVFSLLTPEQRKLWKEAQRNVLNEDPLESVARDLLDAAIAKHKSIAKAATDAILDAIERQEFKIWLYRENNKEAGLELDGYTEGGVNMCPFVDFRTEKGGVFSGPYALQAGISAVAGDFDPKDEFRLHMEDVLHEERLSVREWLKGFYRFGATLEELSTIASHIITLAEERGMTKGSPSDYTLAELLGVPVPEGRGC